MYGCPIQSCPSLYYGQSVQRRTQLYNNTASKHLWFATLHNSYRILLLIYVHIKAHRVRWVRSTQKYCQTVTLNTALYGRRHQGNCSIQRWRRTWRRWVTQLREYFAWPTHLWGGKIEYKHLLLGIISNQLQVNNWLRELKIGWKCSCIYYKPRRIASLAHHIHWNLETQKEYQDGVLIKVDLLWTTLYNGKNFLVMDNTTFDFTSSGNWTQNLHSLFKVDSFADIKDTPYIT